MSREGSEKSCGGSARSGGGSESSREESARSRRGSGMIRVEVVSGGGSTRSE